MSVGGTCSAPDFAMNVRSQMHGAGMALASDGMHVSMYGHIKQPLAGKHGTMGRACMSTAHPPHMANQHPSHVDGCLLCLACILCMP
mmetsp:Transcript_2409/g.5400  ORF Transcript_2409/g.5400 Transcript_2409/m.5400 type:complete len:87 (-) Transcript_2409:1729-1989(-)